MDAQTALHDSFPFPARFWEEAVIHKGVICAGSVVLEVNEKRLVVVNVEKKAVLNVSGIEHKQVLDLSDGKAMC